MDRLRLLNNRWTEVHPRCLRLGVFVAQMAINFADEDAPVLVAHPSANRHVINPAHYGVADEMMSAIVEAKSLEVLRQCRLLGL